MDNQKLSERHKHIGPIRDELISICNPCCMVTAKANALLTLNEGDEIFHTERKQFFVLQPEFSDTLQVHVRHRDEGWQMFCDPRKLIPVSALQEKDL